MVLARSETLRLSPSVRIACSERVPEGEAVGHEVRFHRALGAREIPAALKDARMSIRMEGHADAIPVFDDGSLIVGQPEIILEADRIFVSTVKC